MAPPLPKLSTVVPKEEAGPDPDEEEFDFTGELDEEMLPFLTMPPRVHKSKVSMIADAYHHRNVICDLELAGVLVPGVAGVSRSGRIFAKTTHRQEDPSYAHFSSSDAFYNSYTEHERSYTKISAAELRDWKADFALLSAEGPIQACWAKMKAVLEAGDNVHPPPYHLMMEVIFQQGAAELIYRHHIAIQIQDQLKAGKGIAPLTTSQVMALLLYMEARPLNLRRSKMSIGLMLADALMEDGELDDPRLLNIFNKVCQRDIYAGKWGHRINKLLFAPVVAAAARQMNQVTELDESQQRFKAEVHPLPSYPADEIEDLVTLTWKPLVEPGN